MFLDDLIFQLYVICSMTPRNE